MEIKRLLDVMRALRDPERGCPWDLKQSYKTIVPYTIEEAYEVAEAIDNNDMQELKLELGDLLFQVVFYAQLAEEEGVFNFADVVAAIVEKMIRRHPHVFSDTVYESEEAFSKAWDESKKAERKEKFREDSQEKMNESKDVSVIDGLSKALPALKTAQKMQSKVAKVGFDWKQTEPVYEKIEEEIAEVRQACENSDEENIEEEIGDLLFSVVNLSRHLKVDAENALRKSVNKFEGRFRKVEDVCRNEGGLITDRSEAQLMDLWNRVKEVNIK